MAKDEKVATSGIIAELVTKADLAAAVAMIDAKLDALALRMTVRLGGIVVAAIGALAIVQRLL